MPQRLACLLECVYWLSVWSVCAVGKVNVWSGDVFVRPHFWGHFRALDQTCQDVFLAGTFFGSSGNVFFFWVLGKYVFL